MHYLEYNKVGRVGCDSCIYRNRNGQQYPCNQCSQYIDLPKKIIGQNIISGDQQFSLEDFMGA